MSIWVYGTVIRRDGDDYVVSVRDFPEVVTSGDTEAEAIENAADAIEVSVGFRMAKNEALLPPTPVQDGEHPVGLPALSSAKASLYQAWREAGISKSELARRMGQAENEVRRILLLGHKTKLERLDEAAKALGLQFTIGLAPIAGGPA